MKSLACSKVIYIYIHDIYKAHRRIRNFMEPMTSLMEPTIKTTELEIFDQNGITLCYVQN